MNRSLVGVGLAAGAVIVVIACAGKSTTVGGTGDSGTSGGSSGTSGGSSSGGLVADCPTSPPSQGAACSKKGLECEYGTDVNLRCNTLATCDASWIVTQPQSGCPTPPPGPSCPASYASVPKGSTCAAATTCSYPEGNCACEIYCGPQGPVGRVCDAGTPLTWQCTGASAGCPAIRPHAGTACTQDQQVCQYGDCSDPSMRCQNGAWHDQQQGCPVSSREKKRDIRYLGDEDLAALRDRTLSTRLAQYQYTSGDPSNHLGFIIEDDPDSPAVSRDRGHVDLYSYTSMAVATLQLQSREIRELRREVKELRRDLDEARKTPRK